MAEQNLKCFVIDGVSFIGKFDGDIPTDVAAITMTPDGSMGIGAISPFLDLMADPVFPQEAMDRMLVWFAPAEQVVTVYDGYMRKLDEYRNPPEEPGLKVVGAAPTGTEEVEQTEEGTE